MSVHHQHERPEQDLDPAREGTCAAWVAEVVIDGDAHSAEDLLGKVHANGWQVDEEMVRHCQWFIDILHKHYHAAAEVYMEHPSGLRGTADALSFDHTSDFLHIWDLKYGYGFVNVYQNWQLLCYLWLWCVTKDHYPARVQLAICQPRAQNAHGPYRKWVLDQSEYIPLLGQISQRVNELNAGDNAAHPGSRCLHCSLADGCGALTESVYQIVDFMREGRAYRSPDAQQMGDELTMMDDMKVLFEARYAAVSAEAEARISEGGFVPGWIMEKRYGKKKFTVPDNMIQMITGIDPAHNNICTPAELIRRGANQDVVNGITTTPFIGTKLAKSDAATVAAKFKEATEGKYNG